MSHASTSERTTRAVSETTLNMAVSNIIELFDKHNDTQIGQTITDVITDTENNID